MNSINVTPIVLSGGSGTRLWPLSRRDFPKQFLAIASDLTLFQQAVQRVLRLKELGFNLESPVILGSEAHRFIIKDQLSIFPEYTFEVILEPLPRNTAPAVTLAALHTISKGRDSIMVVSPSDHKISDINFFLKALVEAINLANKTSIVMLGIPPKTPDTGFGYIQKGKKISNSSGFEVKGFFEKPNESLAKDYFDSEDFYWNSGFFIMKASLWLQAIEKFDIAIYEATKNAFNKRSQIDFFVMPDKKLFEAIPANSVDYAVIEHCLSSEFPLNLIELNAGWHDLGSWTSIFKFLEKDNDGNVSIGDTLLNASKNSLLYSTNRLVVALGVENLIVVETPDAVLILNQCADQNVRFIVSELELLRREEEYSHKKVFRPWGWYEVIDQGDNFKVKRITVNPGASLSLQFHNKRSEHWVVIKGTAEIECGPSKIFLKENESTFIPLGTPHRLKNSSDDILEIIEVQSGDYVGEDDIIRIDDKYGRQKAKD